MLGYFDSIILGSTDVELLGPTLGASDRNIIGLDEVNDIGSPDGSLDGSN